MRMTGSLRRGPRSRATGVPLRANRWAQQQAANPSPRIITGAAISHVIPGRVTKFLHTLQFLQFRARCLRPRKYLAEWDLAAHWRWRVKCNSAPMTRETYGESYRCGLNVTVRFL